MRHLKAFSFAPSCLAIAAVFGGIVIACSSTTTTASGPGTGTDAAGDAPDEIPGADAATDGKVATADGSTSHDAAADSKVDVPLNDAGCLTFEGASKVCGFMSDDSVCAYSVTCGSSSDDGQCKINCEMGATVKCYTAADVKCLQDAVKAKSCSALKACKWIL
jgi:hypothetical protein